MNKFRIDFKRIQIAIQSIEAREKSQEKIKILESRPMTPGIIPYQQPSTKFKHVPHVHKASPRLRRDGHA